VIDVGSETQPPKVFISDSTKEKYIALSYCWGQSQPYHLTRALLDEMSAGLDMERLPQTIKDAIEVTRKLGLKYLWVDALCILQDSDDDKAVEIGHMSQVYKNAHVTISAASAANCGEGFLNRAEGQSKEHTSTCGFPFRCENGKIGTFMLEGPIRDWSYLGNSQDPIHGRAWTLQEHWLSPRVLLYGTRGLSWLCHSEQLRYGGSTVNHFSDNLPRLDASWHDDFSTEDFGHPPLTDAELEAHSSAMSIDPAFDDDANYPFERIVVATKQEGMRLDQEPPWDKLWYIFKDMDMKQWRLWESLVSDYTERQLTNAEDKLVAVSALASEFGRMSKDQYLAGLWKVSLLDNLCWYTDRPCKKPSTYRAPSWSWAAIDGRIHFIPPRLGFEFSTGAYIEKSTVELRDASLPYGQVTDGRLTISEQLRPVALAPQQHNKRIHSSELAICDLFTEEELGSAMMDTTEMLGPDGVPPDVQLWALGLRRGSGPLPLDGLIVVRIPDRPGLWRRVGVFYIGRIDKSKRHKYTWVGIQQTITLV